MSIVSTDLTINFSRQSSSEPFTLVEDDGPVNEPIKLFSRIYYVVVDKNTEPQYENVQVESCTKDDIDVGILKPNEPDYNTQKIVEYPGLVGSNGIKRIRLYCCEQRASGVQLRMYHAGDTVCSLGRRYEPFVESITWNKSKIGRLTYNYDLVDDMEVLDSTWFLDEDGNQMPLPVYDQNKQEFVSEQATTGTLVVRYTASFTLLEISYGTGKDFLSADRFDELVYRWNHGNINDAQVPLVRLMAIIPGRSAEISFQREYNPSGKPVPDQYAVPGFSVGISPPDVIYPDRGIVAQPTQKGNETADSTATRRKCWKQNVSAYWPDGTLKEYPCSDATAQEREAVRKCMEQPECQFTYQWVEYRRFTQPVRIFSSDNTVENYIEVQRVTAIEFKAERTDQCQDVDPNPPKNMIMRVKTAGVL